MPSIEELRRMFDVGDLKEEVFLALALDIAMRVNDTDELLRTDILPMHGKAEDLSEASP